MRKLGMIVVLGVAGMALACGGSSSSGDSGAGGTAGGGTSGTGGTAGGGTSGSCNYPPCVSNALAGCEPSGSCVQQTTSAGANICYSNGVKEIATFDATMAINATIKNASKTCATMSGTFTMTGSSTLTIKDGSGKTIGTTTTDSAGNTTVTCTGGQPVTLDSGCDLAGSSSSDNCTAGTCTP
jgi:hypothetical protein